MSDDMGMQQYASSLSQVSSVLNSYGIDTGQLMMVSAVAQGISGAASVYKSAVSAVSALRAVQATKYAANLAKWGPYAAVIAPISVAAGYAAAEIMDRYANKDLSVSEGQRALVMRVLL